jgi:hypothetical protein
MAAYRFHISRMHKLPLDAEKKQKEWDTILIIAKRKNFPLNLIHKLNRQIQQRNEHLLTKEKDKKGGPRSLFTAQK